MSSTAQPTGLTGAVDQQRKFDNSQTNAPGLTQQSKFENKEFDSTGRTTQQQPSEQQPGYLQQAYQGVANLVNTAASALPGTTGATTTGTGQGIAAPQPLHPAAQRLKQQHGPTGGVGSLPGTPNEEDVVRLPEERQHPDPLAEERERKMQGGGRLDPTTERDAFASGAPAGSGTHPHTTGGSALGSNFDHHHGLGWEHQKQSGLEGARIHPDRDQPGFGASTTTHDSSRTHPAVDPRGMSTHHQGLGGEHQKPLGMEGARIHPEHNQPGFGSSTTTHDSSTTHPDQRGISTGIHPHRETAGVGASRPVEAMKDTAHKATGDRDREYESMDDPNRKPSMMEKMKGQAKIISGKMTKDTEKVEEGRALKSAH